MLSRVLIVLALLASAREASAQQAVYVQKMHNYVQTNASSTGDDTTATATWQFKVHMDSTVTGPLAFHLPDGSLGGAVTLNNGDGSNYGFSQSFTTQTALDAAYPNGNYTETFSGHTYTVPLTGTGLYPSAPVGTVTQTGSSQPR